LNASAAGRSRWAERLFGVIATGAPARYAMACQADGGIIGSSVATGYQGGKRW